MSPLPLVLFCLTYLGVALGRVPGLALDRTGFALLGAVAFVASGAVSLEEAKAAIDTPTLAVLFGMMLLSAQYQMSGLYTAIGRRLGRVAAPRRLLLGTILVAALLSAVLTNDVVCFAMAPLVASVVVRAGLPPLPYLLALACATNLGSALTPIGNPQNILIAQRLDLPFLPFVLACAPAVALSLAALFALLARDLRGAEPGARPAPAGFQAPQPVPLDRREAAKAAILTVAAVAFFLSPVPAALTALTLAGVVLTSRKMHTRAMLALVDWHLLALFCALFVVNRGLEVGGWTEAARGALAAAGADLSRPAVLVPAAALLGNLVGNVPAVMLLLPFLSPSPLAGHALALASTFAGNAVLFGSIANLIVAEQAARMGLVMSFRQHLRVGLPTTLLSLLCAALGMALW